MRTLILRMSRISQKDLKTLQAMGYKVVVIFPRNY